MPPTKPIATPLLEILLDGSQNTYYAGDTITGRVVRTAPIVSPQAQITIQLNGRTKSRMIVSRGQAGTSVYRGRFNLFSPGATQKQLADGPVHIPPDGEKQEWPFSITVPLGPDPASVALGNRQKSSFLPLGQRDIMAQPLPPCFYMSGVFINTTYHSFVEYYLEAKLLSGSSAGSGKVDSAIVHLNIMPPAAHDLGSEFELARRSFLCRISTYRLTHGPETGGLSFQQRTRELFSSSKVPELVFSLQVEYPVALQLNNPNFIPFRVLVLPEPHQTSESIRDAPQTITLTGMTFEIVARTDIICAGTLSPHTANQTRRFGFDLKAAVDHRAEPIVLPLGEKAQPLDVAELLQLSLPSAAPLSRGLFSRPKGRLYPSFTTYNIRHGHKLKWSLTVTAAGESTKISDEVDLTLLSSPGSELPPYEEVAEAAAFSSDDEKE